jgi:hypothetical protein
MPFFRPGCYSQQCGISFSGIQCTCDSNSAARTSQNTSGFDEDCVYKRAKFVASSFFKHKSGSENIEDVTSSSFWNIIRRF